MEEAEKKLSGRVKLFMGGAVILVMVVMPLLSGLNVLKGLKDRKATLELSILGSAPDFSLKSTKGDSVTLADLKGNLIIAGFNPGGYSSGADTAYKRLAQFSQTFSEDNGLFFINFMLPELGDTIQSLQNFFRKNPKVVDDNKFIFLPTTVAEFQRLAIGCHLPNEALSEKHPYFALIDKKGNVRRCYDAMNKKATDSLIVAAIMLPKKIEQPEMKKNQQ